MLAALLLGFTVAICAQSQVPCDCDELQICVNSKRLDHQDQQEKCFSDCMKKSNLQNPAGAMNCFAGKQTAIEALMQPMVDCFFDPKNGICDGSRLRRQIFNFGLGKLQPIRTGSGNFWSEGIPKKSQVSEVPEVPQPFDCLRICSDQNRPQPTGRTRQRGKRHGRYGGRNRGIRGRNGGFTMPGLKECTESLRCNFTYGATTTSAYQICKSTANQSNRDQQNEIEQNFCVCMRKALGRNETTIRNQPSASQQLVGQSWANSQSSANSRRRQGRRFGWGFGWIDNFGVC